MELKLKAGHFFGTTSQALSVNGFRFTEKAYSSCSRLPSHAHELSHFCFVLSGNYQEEIAGRSFERAPSALVYYPPDVSHCEKHLTNGRHFLVEIDFEGLRKVRDYGVRLGKPLLVNGEVSLWLATRMYREFRERDELSALVLESIATELLVAASREDTPSPERKAPPWLRTVKEFLCENFAEPPRLDEIANAVGIHPTHLARVFRQFEHCTVGDYIRQLRIDYARQRILGSNEPLVQIALAAGFADQTHFTRSFKRITGMTPTEFRSIFKAR